MSHTDPNQPGRLLRGIRIWIAVMIAGLVVSGVSAFPLQAELNVLVTILHTDWLVSISRSIGLLPWIELVAEGVRETNGRYPFLAYGTAWLAFAHLVIAVLFIGSYRDPVRNKWVLTFGLIACGGVIPLALIAGYVRHIPFGWRLVDCSFGIFGAIPIFVCRRLIIALEKTKESAPAPVPTE